MSGRQRRRARRADLSQHFLRKGAVASRLVDRAHLAGTDLVVEIGSGRGALTLPLAQRAGKVLAVEIDETLVESLGRIAGDNIEVLHDDFLQTPLPNEDYKVFANPPFGRTTDIVRRLAETRNPPLDAWLVTQLELAHRLAGVPYRNETLWSLRLKPRWHVEIVDRLRRTDFDPPPGVDTALIWMHQRMRPLLTVRESDLYVQMIEHGYTANATIGHVMRRWLTRRQIKRLAHDLRFSPEDKSTRLCFEQWLGFVRFAAMAPSGD